MPMPMLMANIYNTAATNTAFQEKKKSAAMAPTWNAAIKMAVIQLNLPLCAARPNVGTSLLGELRWGVCGDSATSGSSRSSTGIGIYNVLCEELALFQPYQADGVALVRLL